MARKRGRGISAGTAFMLSFSVLTLLMGGWIFARISGDMDQITIDPKLLTEPLAVLARNVSDITPANVPQTGGEPAGERGGDSASQPLTPTAAPTPTPTPTPPPVRTLTVNAVGQITLGTELRNAGLDKSSGSYSFSSMFDPVSSAMSGAGLSIATLRTVLSGSTADFDNYCGPPEIVSGLQNHGVNLFNLSTDRLLDHGTDGLSKTRGLMEALQASSAGAYISQEERQQLSVLDIGGVKVGVLPYTSLISQVGRKAASDAQIETATRLLTLEAAKRDIASLREKGAEIIIVLAHWGNRSDTKASKEVRDLAAALVDAGADIILGTNPTCVHEMERRIVTGSDGVTREAFIAYSLGNFLIDESRETPNITGMILRLSIEWDENARRTTVKEAWYMPTWIMRWKDSQGINRYRVIPAGVSAVPDGMTGSIYDNMQKSYQNTVQKLGSDVAQPRGE